MLNKPASELLENFADALEIKGANQFRVRAFRTAARRIDALTIDITELIANDELETVQGIGKGIAGFLREYASSGKVEEYEQMRVEIPAGVFEMLRIPGLGPKTAAALYNELEIASIDELEAAAREDRLAGLRAIGSKRQARLLRELQRFRERSARHLLGHALPIAERLVEHLRAAPDVGEVMYAGSLRRMRETIGDLDILVASDDPDPVMQHFIASDEVDEVLASGSTKTSVLVHGGMQVDLLVVAPGSFGAALTYFTGSKEHNIALRARAQKVGLSLNERGILDEASGERRPAPTEADVYAALGLPSIQPELRESRGEIEVAEAGTLPELIELTDIRGEFHGHSHWSDGAAPVEVMVQAALTRGYQYFGITDHSGGLQVANGLTPDRLQDQAAELEALRAKFPTIRLLHGSEVEIFADGSLDYDDEILAGLDVVVASVHSNFSQSSEQMTERLVAAIHHPQVDVIGHPTGRLLGRRDGYEFDAKVVLQAAAETGTALEINASPERLDLDDVLARRAAELGIPITINSDAHHPEHFEFMRFGIGTARRAWLTAGQVLNVLDVDALVAWLQSPKPRSWPPA